jgi:hypothetical protein
MVKSFLLATVLTLTAAPTSEAGTSNTNTPCHSKDQIVSKQIMFAKGRTTAVVKDRVRLCTLNQYRLRARAEQTMSVNLVAGSHTTLRLWTPLGDMIVDGTKSWSGELKTSGDYFIDVMTDATSSYTLEVTITNASDGAE